jgi:hypothetical protein
MDTNIIGYGSFFHTAQLQHLRDTDASFLGEHQLFYAGRYAMKYIFDAVLSATEIKTIWIPQYYCPFVKTWLEKAFDMIQYYDIDPFDPNATINWSQFTTKDLVLANNFWGVKSHSLPKGERPVIIEDHSHGWLSPGCVESTADFCIASLRKTVPVPLGGIAWKPKNSQSAIPMPNLPTIDPYPVAMTKAWGAMTEAMDKKAVCAHEKDKSAFLSMYSEGESFLRDTQDIVPMQPAHEKVLRGLLFKDFNGFKAKNLRYILPKLKEHPSFALLPSNKKVPFGLLLLFKDREILTDLKQFLVSKAIYPAELWPQNNIDQEYNYLLNIHMDFRYGNKELDTMAAILNAYRPATIYT